jgi:hypothetical protein
LKYTLFAVLLSLTLVTQIVMASPDPSVSTILISVGPSNSKPEVYLIHRDVNVGPPYDSSGNSVNPFDFRPSLYAFTGEQIIYSVVVRDENGESSIDKAVWVRNNGVETICSPATFPIPSGVLPGGFKSATDKRFNCTLTVEPTWLGQSTITLRAYDVQGESSQGGVEPSEMWDFNPQISMSISTSDNQPLHFEQKNAGETAYLSGGQRLKIRNTGNAVLWIYIAGSDLTSSNGLAKCPTSNVLSVSNMQYYALSGTQQSGWVTMPKFNENAACNFLTCKNANKIVTPAPSDELTPNSDIEVNLRITYPVPCVGTFDQGTIYMIAKAV